jgi:hypothetical protein
VIERIPGGRPQTPVGSPAKMHRSPKPMIHAIVVGFGFFQGGTLLVYVVALRRGNLPAVLTPSGRSRPPPSQQPLKPSSGVGW